MGVEMKGLNDVIRGLEKAAADVRAGVVKGVEDVALDLLGRAVKDAPVDTGDLRGSGSAAFGDSIIAKGVRGGDITASGSARDPGGAVIRAKVGFGVPYAFKQDQDRTLRHPRGGKAGYLSDTARTRSDRYKQHIRDEALKPLR